MNILNAIRKKMKKAAAPVVAVPVAVVASASSAFAAIDYTSVSTEVTTAVTDILAGGAILLGAYAGFWGIKKVIALFANG